MKFTKDAEGTGTSLVGYVTATYDQLVAIFGPPDVMGGDKITVGWVLRYADGPVATIYDWKENETPKGLYAWHVGGHSGSALNRVKDTLSQAGVISGLRPVDGW
jgi:hypothetical protein